MTAYTNRIRALSVYQYLPVREQALLGAGELQTEL